MEAWEKYLEAEKGYLEEIRRTQWETIMSAAKAVADATMSGGLIRVFGVGHSHLIADDVFYRSATLGNVQAILEETATGNSEIFKIRLCREIGGVRAAYCGLPQDFPAGLRYSNLQFR